MKPIMKCPDPGVRAGHGKFAPQHDLRPLPAKMRVGPKAHQPSIAPIYQVGGGQICGGDDFGMTAQLPNLTKAQCRVASLAKPTTGWAAHPAERVSPGTPAIFAIAYAAAKAALVGFSKTVANSLIYTLFALILKFAGGLLLAVLLVARFTHAFAVAGPRRHPEPVRLQQ